MEGIFESNPPLGWQEKIMIASNNLEAEAYNWFLWWFGKCDAQSFYWQTFTTALLRAFHDEKEAHLYTKFVHLRKKVNVNDCIHECEGLAKRETRFYY